MTTDTSRISTLAAQVSDHAHGRVPRDLRRRHLLAVAEQLLIERGYGAASMDELALRAGVSKPVIYDLVGSKEALFHEVMAVVADELQARLIAAVTGEPDGNQRLAAGALAFFTWVNERRDAWDRLLSGDDAPVTAAVVELRRGQAELVAGFMATEVEARHSALDSVRIEAAANAVNGAFEALAAWWPTHPELSAADLADLLTTLVRPGLDDLSRQH